MNKAQFTVNAVSLSVQPQLLKNLENFWVGIPHAALPSFSSRLLWILSSGRRAPHKTVPFNIVSKSSQRLSMPV
eukprot:CAMPEP_0184289924 /NCGR_PEP_ID=MMETSP1049-20130417/2288_1 /TAXON_ID=77928 /ORGANISM="Proteomonas sulcata, Strain CCMP704" /LENGTH=73 /DNA_ID=CAMNT_0026596913 /DNA_START=240 /DNA_END=457 /DNA_ORIENTATION=+